MDNKLYGRLHCSTLQLGLDLVHRIRAVRVRAPKDLPLCEAAAKALRGLGFQTISATLATPDRTAGVRLRAVAYPSAGGHLPAPSQTRFGVVAVDLDAFATAKGRVVQPVRLADHKHALSQARPLRGVQLVLQLLLDDGRSLHSQMAVQQNNSLILYALTLHAYLRGLVLQTSRREDAALGARVAR